MFAPGVSFNFPYTFSDGMIGETEAQNSKVIYPQQVIRVSGTVLCVIHVSGVVLSAVLGLTYLIYTTIL